MSNGKQMPGGAAPFGNYQLEIYQKGLAANAPEVPFTFAELEQRAREKLSAGAYGYVAGGAGAEETMRANRDAFGHWRIVRRRLRDVASRHQRTTVNAMQMPALI